MLLEPCEEVLAPVGSGDGSTGERFEIAACSVRSRGRPRTRGRRAAKRRDRRLSAQDTAGNCCRGRLLPSARSACSGRTRHGAEAFVRIVAKLIVDLERAVTRRHLLERGLQRGAADDVGEAARWLAALAVADDQALEVPAGSASAWRSHARRPAFVEPERRPRRAAEVVAEPSGVSSLATARRTSCAPARAQRRRRATDRRPAASELPSQHGRMSEWRTQVRRLPDHVSGRGTVCGPHGFSIPPYGKDGGRMTPCHDSQSSARIVSRLP